MCLVGCVTSLFSSCSISAKLSVSYDDNMIDLIQWRVRIGCYHGNGHYGHGRKTLPGGQHQNVSCGGVKLTLGIFTLGTNIILFTHTTCNNLYYFNCSVSFDLSFDFDRLWSTYSSCII